MGLSKANLPRVKEQVEAINAQCAAQVFRADSFAYPGNTIDPEAIALLAELGFRFAAAAARQSIPTRKATGSRHEPGRDHPLLLPSAGDARPVWTLENLKRATGQAVKGKIAILQFHGAPDVGIPGCTHPPSASRKT